MIKFKLIVLCALLGHVASGQSPHYYLPTNRSATLSQLRDGFTEPPREARLHCYWWWLNSLATKESITRDLEEMNKKGYSGAILFDAGSPRRPEEKPIPAGPVFMGPEWMELFKHAVREADRLNIELSLNVQSGWNPGAPSITPEMGLKKLVFTETEIKGGQRVQIALPQPETKLIYRDVVVQAVPLRSKTSPLKNDAITDWDIKSFSKSVGWQGVYPLHKFREGFDNPVTVDMIRKEEIVDLTASFDGKQLTWNAPAGDWVIIRYGWTCTGAHTVRNSDGWEGLSLDHLDPEAFELFRATVIAPLVDAAKSAGNSVKYLYTDSWEMGIANWTSRFPEAFKKFRGYDLYAYLPVMTGRVVESQDISNRFLHDLRKTVSDCVAEHHYKLFADLAHSHGMGIHPESGGPHGAPIDALMMLGIDDYPQGEFWARSNTHRVSDGARIVVKQCASAGHTNGKRIIAAEGPTTIGPQWERSPRELKPTLDRVFCSGINRVVWQTFTSSPAEFGRPGNEYFNGTHLNPNVTWWSKAGDFISYINRSCFLLQQGLYTADVLYYYGDDVPNFVFLKEEYPELNFGYDWDKCSKDVILNRVTFDGQKIVLPDGMSYRVLVLAPERAIDLNVLKKIEPLVNAGMTVVSPRPQTTTGLTAFPESDRELKAIVERLWGKVDGKNFLVNRVGKGRVVWGRNINTVLAELNVAPDFSFISNDEKTKLDYTHRATEHQDIYFIANRYGYKGIDDSEYRYLATLPDRYEQVECSFRVSGKVPQLWDPKTGEIKDILTYREENGRTIIPIHFEPEGSVFVVFSDGPTQKHITGIQKDGKTWFPGNRSGAGTTPAIDIYKNSGGPVADIFEPGDYTLTWSDGSQQRIRADKPVVSKALSGKWDLHFNPQWKAPAHIQVSELTSWTTSGDPNIKYYSGSATYKKVFSLTRKELRHGKIMLDLGNLQELGAVTINGHTGSLLWSAPFRLDITAFVKEGDNVLEIEVVNLWPNRLIGDGKLPEDQRLTQTNIRKFDAPDAEKYLRQAGLLGPVTLRQVTQHQLK